jgi:hypothetical protein
MAAKYQSAHQPAAKNISNGRINEKAALAAWRGSGENDGQQRKRDQRTACALRRAPHAALSWLSGAFLARISAWRRQQKQQTAPLSSAGAQQWHLAAKTKTAASKMKSAPHRNAAAASPSAINGSHRWRRNLAGSPPAGSAQHQQHRGSGVETVSENQYRNPGENGQRHRRVSDRGSSLATYQWRLAANMKTA